MTYVDPGPDPKFPYRPDHHHFRLISRLIQEMDGDIDGIDGIDPEVFCSKEGIDLASLLYAAQGRMRLTAEHMRARGTVVSPSTEIAMSAIHLDGFVLGYLFAVSRSDMP